MKLNLITSKIFMWALYKCVFRLTITVQADVAAWIHHLCVSICLCYLSFGFLISFYHSSVYNTSSHVSTTCTVEVVMICKGGIHHLWYHFSQINYMYVCVRSIYFILFYHISIFVSIGSFLLFNLVFFFFYQIYGEARNPDRWDILPFLIEFKSMILFWTSTHYRLWFVATHLVFAMSTTNLWRVWFPWLNMEKR